MTVLSRIESELCLRKPGWWDRLCESIPELRPLVGTQQPPKYHAEGDVAIHTRLAVETCPVDCDPDLLWIALLHDIGKPATTHQDEAGRITAYGHAKLGAEMADEILDRLDMPANRRERILWVISHHTFHHSWQLKDVTDLSKTQRRYVEDSNFPLLLEFLRIDSLASKGHPSGLEAYSFYKKILDSINNQGDDSN